MPLPTASEFGVGEPSGQRRSQWPWWAAALIAIAVLGLFAWQQGGDGGSGGPLNAIAEAAVKTQSQPGGRVALRATASSPTQGSFGMTATGEFNSEDRARMVLSAPNPPTGGPVQIDEVVDGTTVYMRSSKIGDLPDGKSWMALDLALGENLDSQLPANADAKGELGMLESVGGAVRKLGTEDVRGVRTTRYGGTITVARQAERLREEGGDGLASVVEKQGSPVQVEAWIDAEGLVRRMRLVYSQPSADGNSPMAVDMTLDFYDLGIEPVIELPPSSEVFDATSEARSNLGLSNDE